MDFIDVRHNIFGALQQHVACINKNGFELPTNSDVLNIWFPNQESTSYGWQLPQLGQPNLETQRSLDVSPVIRLFWFYPYGPLCVPNCLLSPERKHGFQPLKPSGFWTDPKFHQKLFGSTSHISRPSARLKLPTPAKNNPTTSSMLQDASFSGTSGISIIC